MELNEYEKRHGEYILENAAECALFLKKNNEFPVSPCGVYLVGSGARNTIKGGTGSGDVRTRFAISCEEGLKNAGFTVTSGDWLDRYDKFKKLSGKEFIKETKKLARKAGTMACIYSMGFFEEEKNYDIPAGGDGDICVYVLARNSGEGNDRRNTEGDVKLSRKEISDILYLNGKFKKFMLVLNTGGVVDLSPVMEVSNILYLSQLGAYTGSVLAGILTGKYNPSGKLASTWARPEDYPFFNEFGDTDDTYYREGIYVGYRYFATAGKKVLFPFGFGLSYTDFELSGCRCSADGLIIKTECTVKNIGAMPGKETVQVYLGKPDGKLPQPLIELCGYHKTKQLSPGEEEKTEIITDLTEFASYDTEISSWVLPEGKYTVYVGNSSADIKPVLNIVLKKSVVTEKLKNRMGKPDFTDFSVKKEKNDLTGIPEINIDGEYKCSEVMYCRDETADKELSALSDGDLARICLGHYESGFAAIVGSSCRDVPGGAGQTTLAVPDVKQSLTMADGPAGLRLKSVYGLDDNGIYDISVDPLMEKMMDYLPKAASLFMKPPKNRHGKVHYQYTTAIPIGTALAQSFNDEFVQGCGKIVSEEMEMFGVDLWLAPALNIHRNILCGRNFEYYSEDPYLSGCMAAAMTEGTERNGRGVTIKHFACNNQEWNRTNNNVHVSERALREIYLKGFELCIKKAHPKAVMTSYNLINGVHTSESYDLINDILRCEWGYDGLVMSDWCQTGRKFVGKSRYKAIEASAHILSGNDLTMSGSAKDYNNIMKALKKGKITREDLLRSASRVYRAIKRQKCGRDKG